MTNRANIPPSQSMSVLERMQAKIVSTSSIVIGFAMLALVLYWLFTNTLEDIETIFVTAGLLLILAGIVALVKRGYVKLGA